jgi:hypothetical protein
MDTIQIHDICMEFGAMEDKKYTSKHPKARVLAIGSQHGGN